MRNVTANTSYSVTSFDSLGELQRGSASRSSMGDGAEDAPRPPRLDWSREPGFLENGLSKEKDSISVHDDSQR